MIQSSRSVLFDYCSTVSGQHFLAEVEGFGRGGSIRNLMVHIATTYQYWIGKHALAREMAFTEYKDLGAMADCIQLYKMVDSLVNDFFYHFESRFDEDISLEKQNSIVHISPLQVFTHVITHEFHHKGQILSISRHLGYTPVDTDIMR